MKTIKIIASVFAILAFSIVSFAQELPRYYYVEIYEVAIMGTKSVSIDFGKDAPMGTSYKIYDENDKNLDIKNAVSAINYMSKQGWELVTAYDKMVKAGSRTVYIMRLDANKHPNNHMVKDIENCLSEVVPAK